MKQLNLKVLHDFVILTDVHILLEDGLPLLQFILVEVGLDVGDLDVGLRAE